MINTDVCPGPFLVAQKVARSGPTEGAIAGLERGVFGLKKNYWQYASIN
jgi:hypothetical protein